MRERAFEEKYVRRIVTHGSRHPEPAAPGASLRWRYAGHVGGRLLTVIVAEDDTELVVITAYWGL